MSTTDYQLGYSSTGIFGISLFIGNVIGAYLYGALTVQIYLYYMSFPGDSRLFKTIIYAIYLIETVYTILLTYSWGQFLINCYYYLPSAGSIIIPVCGPIVALLTQCIYAYRIWVISKLKFLSWCIIVSIISGAVATVATSVIEFCTVGHFKPPILIWSSVSLLTDLIIASVLIWSLRKDPILSRRLRSRVTHLTTITSEKGHIVAVNIITIATVFVPVAGPAGPSIVLSKLYANSMMVSVNNRISSRRSRDDHVDTSDMVTVH